MHEYKIVNTRSLKNRYFEVVDAKATSIFDSIAILLSLTEINNVSDL